jgi:cation transporter-like permease
MVAGARQLLRVPIVVETIGGLGLIGGAALTGTEWPNFAPLFGLGTALTLLLIGTLPGRVLYSLLGSLGLLINVPWAISRFFPGKGRAPLLILVSGVLIVIVAVLLARQSDRLRTELTLYTPDKTPTASADDAPVVEHT